MITVASVNRNPLWTRGSPSRLPHPLPRPINSSSTSHQVSKALPADPSNHSPLYCVLMKILLAWQWRLFGYFLSLQASGCINEWRQRPSTESLIQIFISWLLCFSLLAPCSREQHTWRLIIQWRTNTLLRPRLHTPFWEYNCQAYPSNFKLVATALFYDVRHRKAAAFFKSLAISDLRFGNFGSKPIKRCQESEDWILILNNGHWLSLFWNIYIHGLREVPTY